MTDGTFERIVVVTGSAGGIGAAVVDRLLGDGLLVIGVDRVEPADRGPSRHHRVVVGDVTDDGLARRVAEEAVTMFGWADAHLFGLVNAAGVHATGDVSEQDDDDWSRVLAVNLTAPMIWSRAVLPELRRSGAGSIVNVASIAGSRARPASAAYVTSKGGLIALSRSTAVDAGPYGVRCNSISPGAVATALLERAQQAGSTSRGEQLGATYLRRIATVREVAGCVAFLLSDDAGHVTGHDLVVDGGRSAGI